MMARRTAGKYRHALNPLIATTINQQLSDDEDDAHPPVADEDIIVTFEDDEEDKAGGGKGKGAAAAAGAGAPSNAAASSSRANEDSHEEGLEATCEVVGGSGEGEEGTQPFVAYFAQAGFLTEGTELVDAVQFRVTHHELPVSHRTLYEIHGAAAKLDYLARGTTPGEYSARGPQYVVAKVDRESGVAQLLPIRTGRIFRLEPRVRGVPYGRPPLSDSEDEDEDVKRQRMAEGFVSTRRTRESRARTEARVTSRAVAAAGDELEGLLQDAKDTGAQDGISRERIMSEAEAYRRIPPHDPTATTARDAYQLDHLLPPLAANAIIRPKAFLDFATNPLYENTDLLTVPWCIKMRCKPCLTGQAPAEQQRRARCLGWLAGLLALYSAAPRVKAVGLEHTLEHEARKRGVRRGVLEAALPLFYVRLPRETGWEEEEERWAMDRVGKNLMLSYALVMSLLAEGGRVPADAFWELKVHLQVAPADLAAHYRELGATTAPVPRDGGLKSYDVALLPPSASATDRPKTLQESFPALKLGGPAKR